MGRTGPTRVLHALGHAVPLHAFVSGRACPFPCLCHGPRLLRRAARIVRLCRVKSAPLIFFSVVEKRSLTLSLANDEYEVQEAAGTMDPLTTNRVTFPGLAGVACRS
jgi:hypothetical protein